MKRIYATTTDSNISLVSEECFFYEISLLTKWAVKISRFSSLFHARSYIFLIRSALIHTHTSSNYHHFTVLQNPCVRVSNFSKYETNNVFSKCLTSSRSSRSFLARFSFLRFSSHSSVRSRLKDSRDREKLPGFWETLKKKKKETGKRERELLWGEMEVSAASARVRSEDGTIGFVGVEK